MAVDGAVLFDIDGTILRAGGAGRRALALAAEKVVGCGSAAAEAAVATVDLRGNTDARIFVTLETALAQPLDRPRFVAAYLDALSQTLQTARVELLPGVSGLLGHLEARGHYVGLLTGNLREGARRKLAAVDLAYLAERDGGFGDDAETRPEVALVAAGKLKRRGVDPERVLVIGDTPHDVSAAKHAGMRALAVATGWNSRLELEAAGADLVVDDLADMAPILRQLLL